MNWRPRAILLWLLAIPAFTGFVLDSIPGSLVPGADYSWLVYGALVHAAVALLLGKRVYRLAVVVSLAITTPVVVLGAGISFAGLLVSGWSQSQQSAYAAHYVELAVTMLTVIPLALAMVAVIPMHRLEHHLLQRPGGVKTGEKIVLMFLRVFGHIIHFVLPNILEVIREEGAMAFKGVTAHRAAERPQPLRLRMAGMVAMVIQVGVEAICASIRYVPLWAEEIARLPGTLAATQAQDSGASEREEKNEDRQ